MDFFVEKCYYINKHIGRKEKIWVERVHRIGILSWFRRLVLICLFPVFICVAVGVWLDNRFHTWFIASLLILGIAAGARNAYALAMDTIRMDEKRRKKNRRSRFKKFCERRRMRKISDRINELRSASGSVSGRFALSAGRRAGYLVFGTQ